MERKDDIATVTSAGSERQIIYERDPIRMRICKHGALMYYANDTYIGRSLDLYGEFSEGEVELFQQIVRAGMTVVDAGANIGVHTIILAKAVTATGRVIAFEPQRPIFQMLCGNLALNQHNNVTTLHAALGDRPGAIKVPAIDYTKGSNFGGLALGQWDGGEQVPVVTLDSLKLNKCHFVKIDVEGMECAVLAGAEATLKSQKPILYVENDRPQNSSALISWLLERSYRLFWHLPRLFNPRNYFGEKTNVFGGTVSINMLCIPSTNAVKVEGLRAITSPDDRWRR